MNSRNLVSSYLLVLVFALLLVGNGVAAPSINVRNNPFSDPEMLNAIAYGPHRDGQHPDGPAPSADQLREDLHLMAPHWQVLRIYGSTGVAETLLGIIRQDALDMKVMLGVWIAPDAVQANQSEIDNAIRLASAYPEIVAAISVGNETQIYWSAHCSPMAGLIEHIRYVRAHVTIPVTVADDFNFWNKQESQPVAAEIDFITMHAHPMWNGIQVGESLAWLIAQTDIVRAMHPERQIIIGETGWATSVHTEGEQATLIKGQPGQEEQKFFYESVMAWSAKHNMAVFFFEAFDENWKGGPHPAEVEKHWGLFNADRSPKAAMDLTPKGH